MCSVGFFLNSSWFHSSVGSQLFAGGLFVVAASLVIASGLSLGPARLVGAAVAVACIGYGWYEDGGNYLSWWVTAGWIGIVIVLLISVIGAGATAPGAPPVLSTTVMFAARSCINGHDMPEPDAFCSVCGSKRSGVPQEALAPMAYDPKDSQDWLAKNARIVVAAIVVVIVVVIGGIGIAVSSGSGQSQSYKDGYSEGQSIVVSEAQGSGLSPSGQTTWDGAQCNLDLGIDTNGDNQGDWLQGCLAATGNG